MANPRATKNGIESGVTLYHPYLEFHKPAWLKQTLLLWDSVRRIVPKDYQPKDDDEIRAAVDAGAVLDTPPEPYVDQAGKRFLNAWQPNRAKKLSDAVNQAAERIKTHQIGAQVGLWRGKISDHVARHLEDAGVLKQDGDWYRTDGIYAGLYMTCLATTIASAMRITCCTDRAILQTNSKFFCDDTPPSKSVKRQDKWASFGLKFPTAENVSSVPMKDILKFRDKHSASRKALRIALADVVNSLAECSDDNAAQDTIRSNAAHIQSCLDEHRDRLSDLRVKAVTTFFRIDRPINAVAITALVAAPDPLSKTLGVIAGFALGIADWWVDLKTEYRELTRDNPWHYLMTVQDRFDKLKG